MVEGHLKAQILDTFYKAKKVIPTPNKEKFIALMSMIDRKGIKELLEWLETTDFYTAPASSKFHLCYEGGLLEHSLNVCLILFNKATQYELNIKADTLILTTLTHDFCKIGLYSKTESGYTYDKEQVKRHATLSIERVKKFVDLTSEETACIRFHMGVFGLEKTDRMTGVLQTGEYTVQDWYDAVSKFSSVLLVSASDYEAGKYEDTHQHEPEKEVSEKVVTEKVAEPESKAMPDRPFPTPDEIKDFLLLNDSALGVSFDELVEKFSVKDIARLQKGLPKMIELGWIYVVGTNYRIKRRFPPTQNEILSFIGRSDKGDGVEATLIDKKFMVRDDKESSYLQKIIDTLLKNGEIFEPRKGSYRILD